MLQAEGEPERAMALLDDAERWYTADMFPDVRPIGALRARVQIVPVASAKPASGRAVVG